MTFMAFSTYNEFDDNEVDILKARRRILSWSEIRNVNIHGCTRILFRL